MPANGANPAASTSSVKTPLANALRAVSSATALRSRSRMRRRTASLGVFPRDTWAVATSASRSSASSSSWRAREYASDSPPTCALMTRAAASTAARAAFGRSRDARLTASTTGVGFRRPPTVAASSDRPPSRNSRARRCRSATKSSGATARSFFASCGSSFTGTAASLRAFRPAVSRLAFTAADFEVAFDALPGRVSPLHLGAATQAELDDFAAGSGAHSGQP